MGGSDQSVNLGGMLGQMGASLGSMGESYRGKLGRNIENMSRPRGASDDMDEQSKLMSWQSKMGRTDEAALTGANMRRLQEQQRYDAAQAKETRELTEKQAIATAVKELEAAVATGTEDDIVEAKENLRDAGIVMGVDTTAMAAGVEQQAVMKVNQAYTVSERERVAQELAEEKRTDALAMELSKQMNQAVTIESLDALLAGADERVAEKASGLYTQASQRIDLEEKRTEKEKLNSKSIEAPIPLPTLGADYEKVMTPLKAEREGLAAAIADFEERAKKGEVLPGDRQALLERRKLYEAKVYQLTSSDSLNTAAANRQRETTRLNKLGDVAKLKITSEQVRQWKRDNPEAVGMLWDDNYSTEEAKKLMRQEMVDSINATYGGETPAPPPPPDDKVYTAAQEAEITKAMLQNPGKSREVVIAKLTKTGVL